MFAKEYVNKVCDLQVCLLHPSNEFMMLIFVKYLGTCSALIKTLLDWININVSSVAPGTNNVKLFSLFFFYEAVNVGIKDVEAYTLVLI